MLFPVERPGESIAADLEFSFSFLPYTLVKTFIIFLQKRKKEKEKKKKKDFSAARLASISAIRWTGNTPFLRVALCGLFGNDGGTEEL